MKVIDSIRRGWNNEHFVKIRKYIRKPAIITFCGLDIFLLIVIIGLLITKKLEYFILSSDVRYNSPLFVYLVVAFFVIQVAAISYGIFMNLHKYRRPSGKIFFKLTNEEGSSYKALHEYLDFCSKINI